MRWMKVSFLPAPIIQIYLVYQLDQLDLCFSHTKLDVSAGMADYSELSNTVTLSNTALPDTLQCYTQATVLVLYSEQSNILIISAQWWIYGCSFSLIHFIKYPGLVPALICSSGKPCYVVGIKLLTVIHKVLRTILSAHPSVKKYKHRTTTNHFILSGGLFSAQH